MATDESNSDDTGIAEPAWQESATQAGLVGNYLPFSLLPPIPTPCISDISGNL